MPSRSAWLAVALVTTALAGLAVWIAMPPGSPALPRRTPTRPAVRIAAASDLRFALADLIAAFEQAHPDVRVEVAYGSSGTLYAQVQNRAPFDLFLSADATYPQRLAERLPGREDPFVYAVGRLALWAPRRPDLKVQARGLDVVTDATLRRIALANPRHAPYGRAAQEVLERLGLVERVRGRLVYGDTVLQVAHLLEAGAAEVGFVAYSLVATPERARPEDVFLVPAHLHEPLVQAGVVLPWARQGEIARTFRAWLLDRPGQTILRRHGFEPPPD
jgi:molybdate transport system substrate-binding protein